MFSRKGGKTMNIKKIHQMVLKDGLRHFKFKNTKYQDVPYEEKKVLYLHIVTRKI